MKFNERSAALRLVTAWYQVLAQCGHLAVQTDDAGVHDALLGVRAYVVEQIETWERKIIAPGSAQFASGDNRVDNRIAARVNRHG